MNIWDWHYRIRLSEKVKQEVVVWKETLSNEEEKVIDETISFFESFYSFAMLFDLMEENVLEGMAALLIAEQYIDDIIVTPALLQSYYEKKIECLSVDHSTKKRLLTVLESSYAGKEISQEYWNHIRGLLADTFEPIVNEFNQDTFDLQMKLPEQKIIDNEHEGLFQQIWNELMANQYLLEVFGSNCIGLFDTIIQPGTAYGAWWDRDLCGEKKDRLVLYKNGNEVKSLDYFYTIIHETYPGHGHFYNRIRNSETAMDHGAMALVEGWATYCEWYAIPSIYTQTIRHNAMAFLKNSYLYSLNQVAEKIWANKKSRGISLEEAMPTVIYATQYIGFLESYYWGALWLEHAIEKSGWYTVENFLEMLSNSDKGEFFRLWR